MAPIRLVTFTRLWHAILDLPDIPQTGSAAGAEHKAAECATSERASRCISTPLRKYIDVVAAAIYIHDHIDAVIDEAAGEAERCALENKFHAYDRDRAGAQKAAAFHAMLRDHRDKIQKVMTRIHKGVRSPTRTLHALPSDPYWASYAEAKRAEMERVIDELDEEDEDGFLPTKKGAPSTGKIVDF